MRRSLFLLALETSAKAIRTGFATVGALTDCGMRGPVVRDSLWLTEFEEENEVFEAPLSADFDDEAEPNVIVRPAVDPDAVELLKRDPEAYFARRYKTPAQMPAQLAAVRSRKAPEEAHPPAASSGVPTFAVLQDICREYAHEHFYRVSRPSFRITCGCGLQFDEYEQWLDHQSELQASALSFAIADARSK